MSTQAQNANNKRDESNVRNVNDHKHYKGTEYINVINRQQLSSIHDIAKRADLQTNKKAIQIVEPDYIKEIKSWYYEANSSSKQLTLSVKPEIVDKMGKNELWENSYAYYTDPYYVGGANMKPINIKKFGIENIKWFLGSASNQIKNILFKTDNEEEILRLANNGNFWTPRQIVEKFGISELIADKYHLEEVPTTDSLFIVYGQEPNSKIVSGTLIKPTIDIKSNPSTMPIGNLAETGAETGAAILGTVFGTGSNLRKAEDYGPIYKPNELYILTYLINNLIHSDPIDFYTPSANTVFSMMSPDGNSVIKQYLKLFDGADLWLGLEPPDRINYSDTSSTKPVIKESVNFQIGPQEFFLKPKLRGNVYVWETDEKAIDIIKDDGKFINFGKFLKEIGRDERTYDKKGTIMGMGWRNPSIGYTKVYDYYIKIDKGLWVRARPPIKWKEREISKIKIWKENEELKFNMDSGLFHRPVLDLLTNEDSKKQLLDIISQIDGFKAWVNIIIENKWGQGVTPQEVQNAKIEFNQQVNEWLRVKSVQQLTPTILLEQAKNLHRKFTIYNEVVVNAIPAPNDPNRVALEELQLKNGILESDILSLTPETGARLQTRLNESKARMNLADVGVEANINGILNFIQNNIEYLSTLGIVNGYSQRLRDIKDSNDYNNFKNADFTGIPDNIKMYRQSQQELPDNVRDSLILMARITELVLEINSISKKLVTEFSLMKGLEYHDYIDKKNVLDGYSSGATDNSNYFVQRRTKAVIPPTVTTSQKTGVKGLGWIKNMYSIDQRGGVGGIPGSSSPGGVTTLDAGEIGQLAAAQIVYKSEGVLMMESILGGLQNRISPIRWLTIKGNQETIKDALTNFIIDEKDNSDLVTDGIQKLIRIVHPTSSKWSRTFGSWNTEHQSNLRDQFIDNVSVAGTGSTQTTTTTTQPQLGGRAGSKGYSLFGGAKDWENESESESENESESESESEMVNQNGGGCGCSGGGNDDELDVKKMIESSVQAGGALFRRNMVDKNSNITRARRYQIDKNKIDSAVDKLIVMLISPKNAEKERNAESGKDDLCKLESTCDFKKEVLNILLNISTLGGRVRWLTKQGNRQRVEQLLPKMYEQARRQEPNLLNRVLESFIDMYRPTGMKKYSKAAESFNVGAIREEFLSTLDNNSDARQSAARALVDRLLLTGEMSEVEGAQSADDVEKILDQYLRKLRMFTSDDKKKEYILGRPQSFQLAWVNYVDQFWADSDAVRKKVDSMISMFRKFRAEKPSLIQTFMVTGMQQPKGLGDIQKAVNGLISELVEVNILEQPAQFGKDSEENLRRRRNDASVPSKGAKSVETETTKQNTRLGENEEQEMTNWINRAEMELSTKLTTYEAEFQREAQRMKHKWESNSEIRKADFVFKKDISNKDRDFKRELARKKNLTSTQRSQLKSNWEGVKSGLKSQFEGYKSGFKSEIAHNSSLAKIGLKPDSQKGWWDWGKDKLMGKPSVQDYRGLQQKMGSQFPGNMGTGDGRSFQDVLRQRQSGMPALPPGPIGQMPPQVSMNDLRRQATQPGFATYRDPATGQTKTMAVTRFPMETSADYARLQKAIMTLDPSSIKQFMNKLGDVASTLPAQQAAKILDHFQRRVLNELDKYCINMNWMLFDEQTNRCV